MMVRLLPAIIVGVLALWPLARDAGAAPKTDLVLAIRGEPEKGYDPLFGWGHDGHPLFHSTLLTRDADLRTKPDLATDWALSGDRLTWTVTIRDDVRFSDGTPLTAEDVAFTFRQAATTAGLADLTVLESARAVGARTVALKLKEPRITFAESLHTLGIVPAARYGEGYAERPVGSGPYRLVQWTRGQQLIVEANPYYYGPKPAFRKLTFLFTGEDATFAAAHSGTVDIAAVPPVLAGKVPSGMKKLAARTIDNRGLMFPTVPNVGRKTRRGAPIGNDVTADRAIRQAINVALDRNALVKGVLSGHGTPAYGPADGLPWSNPQARLPDGGLALAREILARGGWHSAERGVLTKNGREARFTILYPAADWTRQMLAVAAADMLRPLGIVAEAAGKSWDDLQRLMHANVVVFGWGSHNPLEVHLLHHGRYAGTASYNPGFYANPKVDGSFDAAQKAGSLEEALSLWRQAEWDGETGYGPRGDAAWAWLVNIDHVYFVGSCLDLGPLQIEPHGHGWPITAGILNWRWTCP
jgi:peptide/nickel transport system substrate-binding protein